MSVQSRAAVLLLALSACDAESGAEDPLVAAPTITCSAETLFRYRLHGVEDSPVQRTLIGAAEVSGFLVLELDSNDEVRFLADDLAPPAVPPAGPITIDAGSANCFGEGCPVSFFSVSDVSGDPFLEFGLMNTIDDQERTWGPPDGSPLSMGLGEADDDCPASEGATPSVLQVAADGEAMELLPGESATVAIGGVSWHVAAGTAERREFVKEEGACADCADPGLHSITQIEALLYKAGQ